MSTSRLSLSTTVPSARRACSKSKSVRDARRGRPPLTSLEATGCRPAGNDDGGTGDRGDGCRNKEARVKGVAQPQGATMDARDKPAAGCRPHRPHHNSRERQIIGILSTREGSALQVQEMDGSSTLDGIYGHADGGTDETGYRE